MRVEEHTTPPLRRGREGRSGRRHHDGRERKWTGGDSRQRARMQRHSRADADDALREDHLLRILQYGTGSQLYDFLALDPGTRRIAEHDVNLAACILLYGRAYAERTYDRHGRQTGIRILPGT